jgi:hypothetical protein
MHERFRPQPPSVNSSAASGPQSPHPGRNGPPISHATFWNSQAPYGNSTWSSFPSMPSSRAGSAMTGGGFAPPMVPPTSPTYGPSSMPFLMPGSAMSGGPLPPPPGPTFMPPVSTAMPSMTSSVYPGFYPPPGGGPPRPRSAMRGGGFMPPPMHMPATAAFYVAPPSTMGPVSYGAPRMGSMPPSRPPSAMMGAPFIPPLPAGGYMPSPHDIYPPGNHAPR